MSKRLTEDEKDRIRELRAGGMSYAKIGLEVGRSHTTVARLCNPEYNARAKAYNQTPERKAAQKARKQTPEYKAYMKDYRKAYNQTQKSKDAQKARRQTPEYKDRQKAYRQEHKAHMRACSKAYHRMPEHKAAQKARREARQQTPEFKSMRRAYLRVYCQRPEVKLAVRLRARLYIAIKGNFKAGSAVRDLGCTIAQLKVYLEERFSPDMTWDNWAHDGWHIDHVIPLAAFDLTDREQFLQACHYTNLQPLWAADNLSKGAKCAEG